MVRTTPEPRARTGSLSLVAAALGAALGLSGALGACDAASAPATGGQALDGAADTLSDAALDAAADTLSDTTSDTAVDALADAAADAASDTPSDTAADAAADGALDGAADTALDAPAPPPGPRYADVVVEAPSATVPLGAGGFGDPAQAVNGVRGGGAGGGGLDVFSLGSTASDGFLVLRWSGARVVDGPGYDLAVFENPFIIGAGPNAFMDPVIVEVSRDGQAWVALPHDYTAPDETAYSSLPDHWVGFAGVHPVLLHEEDNPVDPLDPQVAGGDAFDLADLAAVAAEDPEAQAILDEGFVYVRLTAAAARTNPDTGQPYPHDPISNGPDIDGVYARTFAEAP